MAYANFTGADSSHQTYPRKIDTILEEGVLREERVILEMFDTDDSGMMSAVGIVVLSGSFVSTA